MASPDFQTLMLPLLQLAGDGKEHSIGEAIQRLADESSLTADERQHMLPSGRQATFNNRVAWASSYLRNAGLLASTGRGRFAITSRGQAVLSKPPGRIEIGFLMQWPEFRAFRGAKDDDGQEGGPTSGVVEQTPEEAMESTAHLLRTAVEAEILARTKGCSPSFFERLVVELLVAMGYGGSRTDAGQAIGQAGDGGVDGIIKEDKLGLDVVYVQAKRWDSSVGRPVVQAFAGSIEGFKARKGVMITTSSFTADARDYVKAIEKRIVLIDGMELARLMFEHGIGVTDVSSYVVKRIDADYFEQA